MAASNILIHLLALGAFVGLGLALLRVQRQRALILDLLPKPTGRAVRADWQGAYVQKFAAAFAIPLTNTVASTKLPPVAVEPELLAKFLFCHGIVALRLYAHSNAVYPVALEIVTHDAEGAQRNWEHALTQALKLPITISVCKP